MLLGILGACGNKKTNIDPFASITKEVDSIRRVADSIHCDESPEDRQPIQADESFDDFIYNFASDDVLQRQRVKFPLPYYNGDKKTNIEEHNWKHDDLFTKQHYYTLLFDREEDMDLVGDTDVYKRQAKTYSVNDRSMIQRIRDDGILFREKRFEYTAVSIEASGVQDRVFRLEILRDRCV